jgi:hypothetical protein
MRTLSLRYEAFLAPGRKRNPPLMQRGIDEHGWDAEPFSNRKKLPILLGMTRSTGVCFDFPTRVRRVAGVMSVGIVLLAGLSRASDAAAPAPAAKLQSSDIAYMDTPFGLDYFNWRIKTITWMPDSAPLMQKFNIGSNTGLGSLVLVVAIKNNSSTERETPEPRINAIFKDASSNDISQGSTAYGSNGQETHQSYPPGAGGTATIVVPNVQQPTADNPITKLVFYQSFADLKPQLIRLLAPPVTVIPAPAPDPT